MTETKTPKPGEFWRSDDGLIAYIVGTLHGDPVWTQNPGVKLLSDEMKHFLSCFHHEPRCDSFEWVEPPSDVWPKYYRGEGWSDADAYVRFDDAESLAVWVGPDGSEERHEGHVYSEVENAKLDYKWRELTEAEALALVKPPEPEFCVMCGVRSVVPGTKTCGVCIQRSIDEDIPLADSAAKALHELAINAGFDPLGLAPEDIAEKLTVKYSKQPRYQSDVTCSIAASERERKEQPPQEHIPDHRPARDVIMDIVQFLDPHPPGFTDPQGALDCAEQWLVDNPVKAVVKRVPVRIWINEEDGWLFANPDQVLASDQEILHELHNEHE